VRLALLAGAALLLASPAGAASLKSKTAQLGPVRAKVSWQPVQYFQAKAVRLQIARDGRTVLSRKLGPAVPQTLRIRDLDGSGEPEVIADFYTGGAHCCLFSLIYRYTGTSYAPLRHVWGDPSYGLRDLDRDGKLELVSADDRFAYAITAYAGSSLPLEIWSYRAGHMTVVTRRFPSLVRKDAATLWKDYRAERTSELPDPRGILAAWMADRYLLGTQVQGWKTMAQLNARGEFKGIGDGDIWAKNGAYLAKLRKFLANRGYARKS
jgi:hypothetical protein